MEKEKNIIYKENTSDYNFLYNENIKKDYFKKYAKTTSDTNGTSISEQIQNLSLNNLDITITYYEKLFRDLLNQIPYLSSKKEEEISRKILYSLPSLLTKLRKERDAKFNMLSYREKIKHLMNMKQAYNNISSSPRR